MLPLLLFQRRSRVWDVLYFKWKSMRTAIFKRFLYLQSVLFAQTDKCCLCINVSYSHCVAIDNTWYISFWIQTPIEVNGSRLTDKMGPAPTSVRIKEGQKERIKKWIVVMGRRRRHCGSFLMLVNKQPAVHAYSNQKREQKRGKEV